MLEHKAPQLKVFGIFKYVDCESDDVQGDLFFSKEEANKECKIMADLYFGSDQEIPERSENGLAKHGDDFIYFYVCELGVR